MDRDEALEMLRAGKVKEWNEYREEHPAWQPELSDYRNRADLSGANLSRADLSRADLGNAYLRAVDLHKAYLISTNLGWADLIGANLNRANFSGANLNRANLSGANLTNAILSEANLSRAILIGADLNKAPVGHTSFADVDLSEVLNLTEVRHITASTVGIDTVVKSKGKIPPEFLRGCGVPDVWIDNIPSLIGAMQPIQFYSCFISYSHQDEEFCKRLHSRMRDEGMRVWFAPEDLKSGRKLHEQVFEGITVCDKLLLVLSEHSMNSKWVRSEIYEARQREIRQGRRILFPIRLCDFETVSAWKYFDSDTSGDLARAIREYYMPGDFMNWKEHDAFEAAFGKLLDALKVEAPAPGPDSDRLE